MGRSLRAASEAFLPAAAVAPMQRSTRRPPQPHCKFPPPTPSPPLAPTLTPPTCRLDSAHKLAAPAAIAEETENAFKVSSLPATWQAQPAAAAAAALALPPPPPQQQQRQAPSLALRCVASETGEVHALLCPSTLLLTIEDVGAAQADAAAATAGAGTSAASATAAEATAGGGWSGSSNGRGSSVGRQGCTQIPARQIQREHWRR